MAQSGPSEHAGEGSSPGMASTHIPAAAATPRPSTRPLGQRPLLPWQWPSGSAQRLSSSTPPASLKATTFSFVFPKLFNPSRPGG